MSVEGRGVEWSGVEWMSVDWARVDWSGVGWSGVEWSGVEWSGVEWSGVEWMAAGGRSFVLVDEAVGARPARQSPNTNSTAMVCRLTFTSPPGRPRKLGIELLR